MHRYILVLSPKETKNAKVRLVPFNSTTPGVSSRIFFFLLARVSFSFFLKVCCQTKPNSAAAYTRPYNSDAALWIHLNYLNSAKKVIVVQRRFVAAASKPDPVHVYIYIYVYSTVVWLNVKNEASEEAGVTKTPKQLMQ